jgi:outer membrane protein TolC
MAPWQTHATTLKEAMDIAGTLHPELSISEQNIEAARGQFIEKSAYAYNPELSLEPQRRRLNGGGRSNDYYITLSQGIELGGKRDYRKQAAQAILDASAQKAEVIRQQLMIGAARAFVELYFSRSLLDLRSHQSATLKQLSMAVSRKLEVGLSNLLNVNLARAALASALSAETDAMQALILAQSQYDMFIGKPGSYKLVKSELPRLLTDWKLPENPITIALESRPEIAALKSRLKQFNAEAELANAERIPDPTLSLMNGREAGERLVKVGISFPIPVLNSHKGAYRAALAEASHARDELEWFEKRLRLEVQAALYNHSSAMQAITHAHQIEGSNPSSDNIKLAQTAFDAGELDLEELVIHINQTLDARLTALRIMKRGWLARIRLAEVLGHQEYILEGIQQ